MSLSFYVRVSPELAEKLVEVSLSDVPSLTEYRTALDDISDDDIDVLREWVDIKRSLREELS